MLYNYDDVWCRGMYSSEKMYYGKEVFRGFILNLLQN